MASRLAGAAPYRRLIHHVWVRFPRTGTRLFPALSPSARLLPKPVQHTYSICIHLSLPPPLTSRCPLDDRSHLAVVSMSTGLRGQVLMVNSSSPLPPYRPSPRQCLGQEKVLNPLLNPPIGHAQCPWHLPSRAEMAPTTEQHRASPRVPVGRPSPAQPPLRSSCRIIRSLSGALQRL